MMPGTTIKDIRDAVIGAYNPLELRETLHTLMDIDLDNILIAQRAFPDQVWDLIKWVDRRGRDAELVQVLAKDRPREAKLQLVSKKYGMATPVGVQAAGVATGSSDAADPGLEKIVRQYLAVPDFGLWREAMTRVEGLVCRITLNGNAEGTGFLVGPDAVLTNYHVLQSVITKQAPPAAVECQFDYKLLKDGTAPYTPVRLAADWLIDASPYSAGERNGTPDNPPPTAEELDYALVRLAEPIGERPWARSPGKDAQAPARGWVRVPDAAPAFAPVMAVIIAQHPDGQPMKLAVDTAAIDEAKGLGLRPPGTRVRYATTTEGGSSGSPCFDFNWQLIALHHYGDPKNSGTNLRRVGDWNQGVPIGQIRDRLTRQNKAAALGGDPP